jgi:hypothetical protein
MCVSKHYLFMFVAILDFLSQHMLFFISTMSLFGLTRYSLRIKVEINLLN